MVKHQPIIVLVRPQLAENIGATARAMANFGLDQLRLVSPQPYDTRIAAKVACHGRPVLSQATVFADLPSAVRDCVYTIATSRRIRRVKIDPITPDLAAEKLVTFSSQQPCALVFGAERTGLNNQEIYLCDIASTIPTAKEGSLNLSQAVILYCYEWYLCTQQKQVPQDVRQDLATHAEKQFTFNLLEQVLLEADYKPQARLPEFVRKIKYLFESRPLSQRENQILLKWLRYMEKK